MARKIAAGPKNEPQGGESVMFIYISIEREREEGRVGDTRRGGWFARGFVQRRSLHAAPT